MSDYLKAIDEQAIIGFFREAYEDFPRGKLVKSESPDFELKINRKRSIGIELTRLFKNGNDPEHLPVKNPRALYKRIVRESRQFFEMRSELKLSVHLSFPAEIQLPRARIGDTAARVANTIRLNLSGSDLTQVIQLRIEPPEAPYPVSEINVLHHPGQSAPVWNYAEVFTPRELTEENVLKLINHKEEKLQIYQKKRFDKYWLIVVVDALSNGSSFNIHNKIEQWNIETHFNKVFLFEQFNRKIFELK